MKLLIKPLFTAVLVAVASGLQAAPPLPINPGLVDAMRPAAYQSEELSLSALEERLRATKAISPMKKLALKAEIDDLLARFRIAHAGGSPSLEELRDPYNRLLAKIQGMLKKDPQLARDIVASRESIWGVLADRTQFASLD